VPATIKADVLEVQVSFPSGPLAGTLIGSTLLPIKNGK
jgi:hypothetical protein